eukprot:c20709_g1_i1 orf=157-1257(+)
MSEAPAKSKMRDPSQGKAASAKTDDTLKVKQEPMELDAPTKGPNILAAENFTHGGIRKAKFEPKVPTRRQKKAVAVKSELGEGGTELPSELMKLVKQSQEDAASRSARRADIRAPTRVAFGSGTSVAGRAAAGFHKGGSRGGGGGGSSGGGTGGERKFSKSLEGSVQDGMVLDDKEEKFKTSVIQSWDLSKYYPVTLPLQKPGTIELNVEDQSEELDENAVPAAEELGLMQEMDEDRYLFFQLPSFLPCSKTLAAGTSKSSESSSSKSTSRSSTKPDHSGPSTWLEDLPPGQMGKLLVHKSGAVKLQLGGTTFEAVAGSQCVFAQELVGINATTQHCCFLGDVTERIVLVPSLNDFLQNDSSEQQR